MSKSGFFKRLSADARLLFYSDKGSQYGFGLFWEMKKPPELNLDGL